MRNRSVRVKFPVYGYEVRVILSRDVRRTCQRLQAGDSYCVACFIPGEDSKRRGYLVLPLAPDEDTIAHEASHAVRELFRWAGAKTDEEAFAYHLGFLVGRIHKFIKR